MKTATTLLLDMDGVMAEVSKSYRASIIATCHEYGATSVTLDTVSEWKTRGGCNNDWVLSRDLIRSVGEDAAAAVPTLEQVTETFERFYQGDGTVPGLCETESLIPTRALLEELHARCEGRTAVVTGRPRSDCDKFLRLHGLDRLFPVRVCMEDGPAKPDPFPVVRACELLGVAADDHVIMVGDTPDDVRAAVRAGCRAVGVATPEGAAAMSEAGRAFDETDLCVAMTQCGAERNVRPGLEELLEAFPKQ